MKTLLCCVLSLFIVACSNLSMQGEHLYQKSANGPNVTVPSPLSSAEISHFYDLPHVDKIGPVDVTPPALKVGEKETQNSKG